jgi:glycine/D-amino acid oxidase-like deaminating enzyme
LGLSTSDFPSDSVWAATAPPPPPAAPLAGKAAADFAIVGAGYTGLSTALHLAAAGRRVIVLEAGEIGRGASGRNNGQVIPGYSIHTPRGIVETFGASRGARLNTFVGQAARATFDLIRAHDIPCDAVQTGWVQPAHAESRLAGIRESCEQWQALGEDVAWLTRDETAAILGAQGYFGGWIARTGGHLNALGLARGLAAATMAKGGTVHANSPATGLARTADGWRLTTPGGHVDAGAVLLATNSYTAGLWPGLDRSFVPVRSYQVATRPLDAAERRRILPGNQAFSDTRGDLRGFHYDRDGRLVTGGGHFLWHNARARGIDSRRAMIGDVFPMLADIGIDYYWDGVVAVAPARLPHVHNPAPGLYAALAYSGRGVALATALGAPLAQWMAGEIDAEALPIPARPVRPLPAHAVARLIGGAMRSIYRWRDAWA